MTEDVLSDRALNRATLARQALLAREDATPTELIARFAGESRATMRDGVWMAPDGGRALLLAQTRAAGIDIDGQEAAIARIRAAFADATRDMPAATPQEKTAARLILSGPGAFATRSRTAMKDEVSHLSLLATGLVGAILLGSIQEYARVTISSAVNLLIVGVLLVAFVIIAPNGLVGLVKDWMRTKERS